LKKAGRRKMKKMILAIPGSIIAVIMLILAGSMFLGSWSSDDDPFKPMVHVSENEVHVNEPVQFNVTGVPEDTNVTWYFGDGNVSHGLNANHSYEASDQYTVICTLNNGEEDIATGIVIFVNNEDYHVAYSGVGLFNVRRGWEYRGEGAYLYPGIYPPVVDVRVTVENVFGTVEVGFWFVDLEDQPGGTLYSERYNLVGSDLVFEKTFNSTIIPEIMHESVCGVDLMLRNGAAGNWKIEIWVTYEN